MTDTTKEIFEKYEIRKTKEQRRLFREYVTKLGKEQGYKVKTEKAGNKAHNVIIGDPESADVVYTAHYDTCAVMPLSNFITPKCIPIYLIYQLILTTIIFIVPILVMFVISPMVLDTTESYALYLATLVSGYALMILSLYLMMAGPANKHTANDNTSGVTLLIDIMNDLPEELRDKVAFIFFDLEELGTIGSKGYALNHKELSKKMLVINFDCVSDGDNILFVPKKAAYSIAPKLEAAFAPTGEYASKYSVEVTKGGAFYPSDQRNFTLGVGVAALNKSKHGILYMNKIHTQKDTVYDEENIEFLKNGAIKFAEIMSQEVTANK